MRAAAFFAAAACAVAVASAIDVPRDIAFSDAALPKTEDIVKDMFAVLGSELHHAHDIDEEEVRRSLLGRRNRARAQGAGSIGALLGGAAAAAGGINYTQAYEAFNTLYCSEPEGSRPSPPSIALEDPLYTKTVWTGPVFGIQFTTGACADAGGKTFACARPQLTVVKEPATVSKVGPSAAADKPGGAFDDKSCAWGSDSKTIGAGETIELYNGGSETYDYSGYRAALYGRTGAQFAKVAQAYQNIAGAVASRPRVIPPLREIMKRRGLRELDTDAMHHTLRAKVAKVLPGFAGLK